MSPPHCPQASIFFPELGMLSQPKQVELFPPHCPQASIFFPELGMLSQPKQVELFPPHCPQASILSPEILLHLENQCGVTRVRDVVTT